MLRTHSMGALCALWVCLALSHPVLAQEEASNLKAQIEELRRRQQEMELQLSFMRSIEEVKATQAEILRELEEIKRLLQARTAAPPAPDVPNVAGVDFQIGPNPVRGESAARLLLIEFTDYQ